MTKNFYADLPPFSDYKRMVEHDIYSDLPKDWSVVLTDVKGSTKAIDEGRYKEVNMVGVSCIVAVQNALGELPFPYIFGGDGATLAVPNSELDEVRKALSHTRAVARKEFGMDLRIAIISSEALAAYPLKVAKLQVSENQYLATVRGEGWAIAEKWMKERESEFNLPETAETVGDMEGLECRWNPLPARKFEILALIIQARTDGEKAAQIYRDLLVELLNPELRPISLSELKLAWPPKFLLKEVRLKAAAGFGRLALLLKTLLISLLHFLVLKARGEKRNLNNPIPYLRELTQNTDYLKFDEALRMIIDVSEAQKTRLLGILENHYQKGEIFYGYHADPNALLTCYIQGPHKHIHFVDAGGGGYAMAAKKLKAQKKLVN